MPETQKKKTPWGALFALMVIFLILSYFISGLFVMDGVTVQNYQDKLLYIILHQVGS